MTDRTNDTNNYQYEKIDYSTTPLKQNRLFDSQPQNLSGHPQAKVNMQTGASIAQQKADYESTNFNIGKNFQSEYLTGSEVKHEYPQMAHLVSPGQREEGEKGKNIPQNKLSDIPEQPSKFSKSDNWPMNPVYVNCEFCNNQTVLTSVRKEMKQNVWCWIIVC